LIDASLARWYHCVSSCVRRAFSLGEGAHERKGWIENRLVELADRSITPGRSFGRESRDLGRAGRDDDHCRQNANDRAPSKLTFKIPVDLAKRFAMHARMPRLSKRRLSLEMVLLH